jgi:hypothetical protein
MDLNESDFDIEELKTVLNSGENQKFYVYSILETKFKEFLESMIQKKSD